MSNLDLLLRELRAELRAETPSVLHSYDAPTLRDRDGLPDRDTDQGGIGPPFTAAMHRHLGHPDGWGTSRMGMSSILEVSDACASRHPNHRRPLFTRTVCGQLAFEAGYLGQELTDLVFLHPELDLEQIVGMLTWGLRHAEEWRAERFAQWSKVPGQDAPIAERRPYRSVA